MAIVLETFRHYSPSIAHLLMITLWVKLRFIFLRIFAGTGVLLHFNLECRFDQIIFFSEPGINKFFQKIDVVFLICSFSLHKVHSTFEFMCLFCLDLSC